MKMAIATVERLSKDFLTFVEYRPVFEDKYDRMLQFFLKNEGKYFSKTELMTKHRQKFGYSRDNFRKNFEYDIEIVAEMAKSENYDYFEKNIKQGERYQTAYYWSGKDNNIKGHVLTIARDETGELRLYDPQTNKIKRGKEIINY